MAKSFIIQRHRDTDKSFVITGPVDLRVDYDDVDQESQDIYAALVTAILNDHWFSVGVEYQALREALRKRQRDMNLGKP